MTQITQQQVHSTDGSADLSTQLSNMAQSVTANALNIQATEQDIQAIEGEIEALGQKVAGIPVKGTVATITDLPSSVTGDALYFVRGTKQFYVWDATANPAQWVPASAAASGSGSSGTTSSGNQITKLGITGATSAAPYLINATIPQTLDFNRAKPEVLKFTAGSSGVVNTICAFDNADSTSFVADPLDQVVFDGTMHLKTSHNLTVTDGGVLGSGHLWSATIDRSKFKSIEKITVS